MTPIQIQVQPQLPPPPGLTKRAWCVATIAFIALCAMLYGCIGILVIGLLVRCVSVVLGNTELDHKLVYDIANTTALVVAIHFMGWAGVPLYFVVSMCLF